MSPEQARGEQHRRAQRRLLGGRHALRAHDRQAPLQGLERVRDAEAHLRARVPAPERRPARLPAGARADRHEGAREGRERSLPERARDAGGPRGASCAGTRSPSRTSRSTSSCSRLFEDKLAMQKEALLQGKQLADIIEMQHAMSSPDMGDVDASGRHATSTQSMPAAARTVTDMSTAAHRTRRAASSSASSPASSVSARDRQRARLPAREEQERRALRAPRPTPAASRPPRRGHSRSRASRPARRSGSTATSAPRSRPRRSRSFPPASRST